MLHKASLLAGRLQEGYRKVRPRQFEGQAWKAGSRADIENLYARWNRGEQAGQGIHEMDLLHTFRCPDGCQIRAPVPFQQEVTQSRELRELLSGKGDVEARGAGG